MLSVINRNELLKLWEASAGLWNKNVLVLWWWVRPGTYLSPPNYAVSWGVGASHLLSSSQMKTSAWMCLYWDRSSDISCSCLQVHFLEKMGLSVNKTSSHVCVFRKRDSLCIYGNHWDDNNQLNLQLPPALWSFTSEWQMFASFVMICGLVLFVVDSVCIPSVHFLNTHLSLVCPSAQLLVSHLSHPPGSHLVVNLVLCKCQRTFIKFKGIK